MEIYILIFKILVLMDGVATEVESNRIIIWRMDPVAWEGYGQVCVGTLVVINCGAIDGLRRV